MADKGRGDQCRASAIRVTDRARVQAQLWNIKNHPSSNPSRDTPRANNTKTVSLFYIFTI